MKDSIGLVGDGMRLSRIVGGDAGESVSFRDLEEKVDSEEPGNRKATIFRPNWSRL
jgi:hypothetical protein